MKSIFFVVACSLGVTNAVLAQQVWSEDDRKTLIDGLEETKSILLEELDGLSDAQWHFKPDTSAWSIAQVVEHLAVYEEYLYWDLFYGQYTPERRDLVDKVKGNDEEFLAYATDKSKGNSPWVALPIGRFDKGEDLTNFFVRFRDQVIEYVESTDSDLRLHFTYRAPGGGIWTARDLHQHTLIWIAHTTRHTDQIKRNKSASDYPKK